MKKEVIYDIAIGAAIVALGYALWQHFKGGAPAAFSVSNPLNPAPGVSVNPANPGAFMTLADMLKGAVHDVVTGIDPNTIPKTTDIFSSVTGYTAPDSVVKVPGALW